MTPSLPVLFTRSRGVLARPGMGRGAGAGLLRPYELGGTPAAASATALMPATLTLVEEPSADVGRAVGEAGTLAGPT
jgi:hypothetical protein